MTLFVVDSHQQWQKGLELQCQDSQSVTAPGTCKHALLHNANIWHHLSMVNSSTGQHCSMLPHYSRSCNHSAASRPCLFLLHNMHVLDAPETNGFSLEAVLAPSLSMCMTTFIPPCSITYDL